MPKKYWIKLQRFSQEKYKEFVDKEANSFFVLFIKLESLLG